jgi:hypothetical protein
MISRQARRAICRKAAKLHLLSTDPDLTRSELRGKAAHLAKRAYLETASSCFESHVIERPRIIIPEVVFDVPNL